MLLMTDSTNENKPTAFTSFRVEEAQRKNYYITNKKEKQE